MARSRVSRRRRPSARAWVLARTQLRWMKSTSLSRRAFLFFEDAFVVLPALLALQQVGAVVAGIDFDPVRFHLPDGIDGVIEEIAVVADDQHRAFPFAQDVFQPFHRFDIQVVGGLVQHQQVGLFEQQARQQGARLLPAGEVVERHVPGLAAQAEPGQGLLDAQLVVVAAGVCEGLLQAAVCFEQVRPSSVPAAISASSSCRRACWSCRSAKTVSISA